MKIRLIIFSTLIAAALALGACAPQPTAPIEPVQPPAASLSPLPPSQEAGEEPTAEPASHPSGRTTFGQLGISLVIPEDLMVVKEPTINLDDPSKLQGYLFYIENDWPPGSPVEEYFQMYGHLQFIPMPGSWEEYKSNILSSEMYAYAREIEINGLPGIDSQFAGQRNRYVYHFPLDDQVLSIAVSHPTEENKALADEIISSLEYTPGALTDASGVQLVKEPNGYYQMYLPADWQIEFGVPAGIRLSDLQASSPGAEVIIEESEGPHARIYYQSGNTLNVAVLDDDSALSEPAMAQVISQTPIMIAGIEGSDTIFLEPSTAAGEIREVRFYHNGLSYLVRFSYAANADRAEIDWLIRNFLIAP